VALNIMTCFSCCVILKNSSSFWRSLIFFIAFDDDDPSFWFCLCLLCRANSPLLKWDK
jgi:hypothetical protein